MPILQCSRKALLETLGLQSYTDNKFRDLCFEFGIELDDVTSEREMYLAECGGVEKADKKLLETKSSETVYKIELPANRYDLLCFEGLAGALLVFLGKRQPPTYKFLPVRHTMTVKPSILPVRPYVVCAILRGMDFSSQERYRSFIDLQEKLHGNIARQRTLCSVGTHDLSTVKGEFTYEATPKGEVNFLPLAWEKKGEDGKAKAKEDSFLRGDKIEEYYAQDKHIGRYVPLISKRDAFPVVYDSNRTVMSLPPIINSDHSKISAETKDIFIEVTAIDFTKANLALNMIIAAFSEFCAGSFVNDKQSVFQVEPVKVIYPEKLEWLSGTEITTPIMDEREFTVGVEYITTSVGIKVDADKICELLTKMLLVATPSADKKQVHVKVPCTRTDILHECDIMEDVAIAYGYNKILSHAEPPKTLSYGSQQPREALKHLLRTELGLAGYTEMLTFSLCSEEEATKLLRRTDESYSPFGVVSLANPRTKEFNACRPSLLPGTLKTLGHSKDQPLPMQVFEVTDIVLKDTEHRIGARNESRVCAARGAANSTGFSEIHGIFEHTMLRLGVPKKADGVVGYHYEEASNDGAFFPGWQVDLFYADKKIGSMGVVHPLVLKEFDIPFPCSYMEYNVEPFLEVTKLPKTAAVPAEN
eukprot:TRINITY_DN24378_c0_g1_i1.p2 TRINITY_DN24378_c0_g1~~TRINITY_DN24378_c0_g1_i1.p2  ORF type:complete len:668 (+),score=297.64 TRINITY_DN24378_c0_g1_i1:72-2006(+)